MSRLTNLASLSVIQFFLILDNKGFDGFLSNRSFIAKIMIQSITKSEETKRGHIWLKLKWAFSILLADDSRKISLKIFEQEIRKIFKIFRSIFDQKSQNNVIWFLKQHIKIMWLPTRKLKVTILKSVFRWFEINIERKILTKIRHFFIMFGTF
jgi:hypothetical protein